MGEMTGGEYSVVCEHLGDKGLGCLRKQAPGEEGEENTNPTLVYYFPKKCWSGLFCPSLMGDGLMFVHQVFRRAEYFIPCTSGKFSKFC